MTNKLTIREGISVCKRKLETEGYRQANQPYDNHVFGMRANTETILDALVKSGMFGLADNTGYRGKFRLINLKYRTAINLEHNAFPKENGWVYSTLHYNSAEERKYDLSIILHTIEDLFSVAETNKIPMKTVLGRDMAEYEPQIGGDKK